MEQEHKTDVRVKDIMTDKVISAHIDSTVADVAELIHKYHVTGVPVIKADQTVVGVIMERDFITADSKLYLPTYIQTLQQIDVYKKDQSKLPYLVTQLMHAKARDILNSEVVTVNPEDTIEELSRVFAIKRVNPVPVVNKQNQLIGIVSRSDLIKFFIPDLAEQITQEPAKGRLIDSVAAATNTTIHSNYSLVSKNRIFFWFSFSLFLLAVGFILGIFWMINFG